MFFFLSFKVGNIWSHSPVSIEERLLFSFGFRCVSYTTRHGMHTCFWWVFLRFLFWPQDPEEMQWVGLKKYKMPNCIIHSLFMYHLCNELQSVNSRFWCFGFFESICEILIRYDATDHLIWHLNGAEKIVRNYFNLQNYIIILCTNDANQQIILQNLPGLIVSRWFTTKYMQCGSYS